MYVFASADPTVDTFTCELGGTMKNPQRTYLAAPPTLSEWKGKSIKDRVDLVMLQVHMSLRPEVERMANQMLDEANVQDGDSKAAIDALFWGFKNRFHYTPDPWELDLFTNAYRAWLIGGGSPNGDLNSGGVWYEDCDGAAIALIALAYLTARRTGIHAAGAKVIGKSHRNYVHVYVVMVTHDGKHVMLDATVPSAVPGWEAPEQYRRAERIFWFDATKPYEGVLDSRHRALVAVRPEDLDRSSVKRRVDAIMRRIYYTVRDPGTRVSAIRMLRESSCEPRQDMCDVQAILDGVKARFVPSDTPVGGSIRTLCDAAGGEIDDVDGVSHLTGDRDDCAVALASLALVIGFRVGIHALKDGTIVPAIRVPRNKDKSTVDLDLLSGQPFQSPNEGRVYLYREHH